MPVNNPLERILREIRRRTRVVGAFPDGQSALNLAAARLRHVAGTEWSTKRYLSMDLLKVTSRRSSPPEPQPGAAQPNQMCERNWTPPQVDPQFERVAAAPVARLASRRDDLVGVDAGPPTEGVRRATVHFDLTRVGIGAPLARRRKGIR